MSYRLDVLFARTVLDNNGANFQRVFEETDEDMDIFSILSMV